MNNNSSSWLWIVIFIVGLFWWSPWSDKPSYKELDGLLSSCENELLVTHEKLNVANDRIEIAKWSAFGSFEEMRATLEGLEPFY